MELLGIGLSVVDFRVVETAGSVAEIWGLGFPPVSDSTATQAGKSQTVAFPLKHLGLCCLGLKFSC